MTRIVVLGNSNSILRDGWLPAFQAADPSNEVSNMSLGGSPSPVLLYQVIGNLNSFKPGDVAIVEPTVVDCGEKGKNGDEVAGHASALLRVLLSIGVVPVLLVLPRLPRYIEEPSPGMLAWASVAASLGVCIFDGTQVIKSFAALTKRKHEELWRDDQGHHTPDVSRIIGIAFSRYVAQHLANSNAAAVSPLKGAPLAWRVLFGGHLAEINGLPSRKSSTALASVECVVMCAGDTVSCKLAMDEKLLGLAVNYGELEPVHDLFIKISGPSGSKSMNVKGYSLPAGITHKTRVIFRAANFPVGYGDVSLPDLPENARFSSDAQERLEIAGMLVGQDIGPITGWQEPGLAALAESRPFTEAFFETSVRDLMVLPSAQA